MRRILIAENMISEARGVPQQILEGGIIDKFIEYVVSIVDDFNKKSTVFRSSLGERKTVDYLNLEHSLHELRFKRIFGYEMRYDAYKIEMNIYPLEVFPNKTTAVDGAYSINVRGNNAKLSLDFYMNIMDGYDIGIDYKELQKKLQGNEVRQVIAHEFHHQLEADKGKTPNKTSAVMNRAGDISNEKAGDNSNVWKFFKLIYVYSAEEMQARQSEAYETLKNKGIKNANTFAAELKKTQPYKYAVLIDNVSLEEIFKNIDFNDFITKWQDEIVKAQQFLNVKVNFRKFTDKDKFLQFWNKYFNDKKERALRKLYGLYDIIVNNQ